MIDIVIVSALLGAAITSPICYSLGRFLGYQTAPGTIEIKGAKDNAAEILRELEETKKREKAYKKSYDNYKTWGANTKNELDKLIAASKTWELKYQEKPKSKKIVTKEWTNRYFNSSAEMNCKHLFDELVKFGDNYIELKVRVYSYGQDIEKFFQKANYKTDYTINFDGSAKSVAEDVKTWLQSDSFPLSKKDDQKNVIWVTDGNIPLIAELHMTTFEEKILPVVHKVEVPIISTEIREVIIHDFEVPPIKESAGTSDIKEKVEAKMQLDPSDPAFMTAVEVAVAELQGRGKFLKHEPLGNQEPNHKKLAEESKTT